MNRKDNYMYVKMVKAKRLLDIKTKWMDGWMNGQMDGWMDR